MFARRRHNRLMLANRGFQFGIGIIQQLIKRFLPKLSGRFWRRIIGYRGPDNAVVIRLIIEGSTQRRVGFPVADFISCKPE